MELKEFLQKFSPNYNDIEKEALTVEKEACNLAGTPYTEDERNSAKYQLLIKRFPVALQNFADKICEVQRELCNDHAHVSNMGYWVEGVLDADQPEIDDYETEN
jgi:hypothetical protein